ncbi:hypothetical protein BDFB_014358 [Asbolus verrucosus]|uniref:Uncharacterized protein n=1 Tax=Asbolus verrucosus TaxID=1661398 RepID=A0A482VA62_ASBVE|nr:hypothetical protein BDFB_014358 [Asbolus verrucosus]
MNEIQLCSMMNPDFVWGPTMDDKGSEDVGVNDALCSSLWNVMSLTLKITNLPHLPQTLAVLRHEVQIAWDFKSPEEIDNFLRSMPR